MPQRRELREIFVFSGGVDDQLTVGAEFLDRGRVISQLLIHLGKSLFCLLEKTKYDALAEFTVAVVVVLFVHFEDLVERGFIDIVTEVDRVL